jgi:hypothetical protein
LEWKVTGCHRQRALNSCDHDSNQIKKTVRRGKRLEKEGRKTEEKKKKNKKKREMRGFP